MASLLVVCAGIARRSHGQDEPETTEDAVQNILFATESFGGRRTSMGRAAMILHREPATERMMQRTLIRYKTKPELADKNAELIAAVFEELKAAQPEGVRYLSLRLDDNSFVHFVETESDAANAIPGLAAFKAFQNGIRERCVEPPQAGGVTIVGNYRMLG
jgi:hypothetical protein